MKPGPEYHIKVLTRSLREPGGPCTKSMEVPESRMERVKIVSVIKSQMVTSVT